MSEPKRNDALIAALRCFHRMQVETNLETRRSLWRAACKYAHRARCNALAEQLEKGAAGIAGERNVPAASHRIGGGRGDRRIRREGELGG